MCYIPLVLIAATCFTQVSPPAQPTKPSTKPDAAAAAKAPTRAPAQTKPADTKAESAADKLVREAADKIEKFDFVSGRLRQVIHYPDQDIIATGTYKRGPNHRTRIELDVKAGEAVGKRIQVCDGSVAYVYEKLLEHEDARKLDIRQILPLLDNKDLAPQIRQFYWSRMPIARPAEMLRGYLNVVSFTKSDPKELGTRKVIAIEGQWKSDVLATLAGKPNAAIDDLQGLTPQFIRLFLDEQTRWPLRIELFRRDKQALYKPVYVLEFPDLRIGEKLPDKDFVFEIPPGSKVTVQDMTQFMIQELQAVTATSAKAAAASPVPALETQKPAGAKP